MYCDKKQRLQRASAFYLLYLKLSHYVIYSLIDTILTPFYFFLCVLRIVFFAGLRPWFCGFLRSPPDGFLPDSFLRSLSGRSRHFGPKPTRSMRPAILSPSSTRLLFAGFLYCISARWMAFSCGSRGM